jgi:hypothetical protein
MQPRLEMDNFPTAIIILLKVSARMVGGVTLVIALTALSDRTSVEIISNLRTDGPLCGARFRHKFTLEDAIGSHACSLEALACMWPMAFLSGIHASYRLAL